MAKSKDDNFVYGTVYEQNIWTHNKSERRFTICNSCNTEHYIDELDDGFCPQCSSPLLDAHGDALSADSVEKACWAYLSGINEKAVLTTKCLDIIQKIIDGNSEVEITDIIKQLSQYKHHVGFLHEVFSDEIGFPVENHCSRENINAFGDTYEKVTWKCGFILSESLFQKCKDGVIIGMSFGGLGSSTLLEMKE